MPMDAKWLEMNIKEIQKRTVSYGSMQYGNIIAIQGDKKEQINLIHRDGKTSAVLFRDIICYNKLKTAETLEQRILIVLDSVRSFDFSFYFDERVSDIIINGRQ